MTMRGEAAVRTAEALLRGDGGRSVLLRMPGPAAAGSAAEELGLATPVFEDLVLWPAVFRKAETTAKLLVAAGVVEALVGSLQFDSAAVLFETAAGVVVDGVMYGVEGFVASKSEGVAYCYCVELKAPVW